MAYMTQQKWIYKTNQTRGCSNC